MPLSGATMTHTSDRQALHRTLAAAALAAALSVLTVVAAAPPAGAAEHEVKPGENLTGIAARYGVSAAELARLNELSDPNHLLVGARLRVPGDTSSSKGAGTSKAVVGASPVRISETAPAFAISESEQRETGRLLHRAAREFGVPPSLLKALTYTESRWRQDVVSRSGAIGVGQVLPETAHWLAAVMQEPGLDPTSKVDNVRLSARLLRFLLDQAGTPKRALAAYYQGIGSVLRDGVSEGGARYARIITSRQAWFS
jgi:soluble lytic murein transglycosylase-like protein